MVTHVHPCCDVFTHTLKCVAALIQATTHYSVVVELTTVRAYYLITLEVVVVPSV